MRKVGIRQLQKKLTELNDLPIAITRDGEIVAIVLSVQQHNQLVRQYIQPTQAQPTKYIQARDDDILNLPIYQRGVHGTGDLVRLQRGTKWVRARVPALDGDGNLMPWQT